MVDLVILGAGPAGIGAAHRAATAGLDVVVLEREDAVGGAARSITVGGVRCDLGSHRLHRAIDPSLLSVLDDLLGPDLQRRRRRGRIRLGGRWLPFPLQPVATLRNLPSGFAIRAAVDGLVPRAPAADNFDEVVRAGLGPTMADRFYGPYARKLWGLAPTEIAGEQAR
ncbi:MAG TPA: FAD-dependent oxidoreductase, partial [Nitriliruptoraceae bacterium]|nr:FAD-dependent oxidoreductase [Nitriliruptoraceae bacterium]